MPEVQPISAAEGNGQKSMPPRRRGSVQQGLLAYYVLEGVSFVLAAFRRARIAWLIPQGEPFVLTRGAYSQYVSTTKWRPACTKRFGGGRERRWRLFSTFPYCARIFSNNSSTYGPINARDTGRFTDDPNPPT